MCRAGVYDSISGKRAPTAGAGPCRCIRSMCLVIAAPHIRDSPGIAEDARGDPFPAKLALIAKTGDAFWACWEGAQRWRPRWRRLSRATGGSFRRKCAALLTGSESGVRFRSEQGRVLNPRGFSGFSPSSARAAGRKHVTIQGLSPDPIPASLAQDSPEGISPSRLPRGTSRISPATSQTSAPTGLNPNNSIPLEAAAG